MRRSSFLARGGYGGPSRPFRREHLRTICASSTTQSGAVGDRTRPLTWGQSSLFAATWDLCHPPFQVRCAAPRRCV